MTGLHVEILADSIAPNGARLTSFYVKCHQWTHKQLIRHRALSFSVRSMRAVPTKSLLAELESDPVYPIEWNERAKGMTAGKPLSERAKKDAVNSWEYMVLDSRIMAEDLMSLGVAKEVCNRIIEPYTWAHMVISGTDWLNFFALRCHPDAQPECRETAVRMARLYRDNEPARLELGDWHLPYVTDAERAEHGQRECRMLSVARCGRVSFKPFSGQGDFPAEVARAERFADEMHVSPWEHQGTPLVGAVERSANFRGWRQLRSTLTRNVHDSFDFSKV